MSRFIMNRRSLLRAGAAAGITLAAPMHFVRGAYAQDQMSCNMPTGSNVVLGFNVPQTGPYADEGLDELKALQLAAKQQIMGLAAD